MTINCKRKDVCQGLQLFANVDGPVTVLCDDEVANGVNSAFQQCKWLHVPIKKSRIIQRDLRSIFVTIFRKKHH